MSDSKSFPWKRLIKGLGLVAAAIGFFTVPIVSFAILGIFLLAVTVEYFGIFGLLLFSAAWVSKSIIVFAGALILLLTAMLFAKWLLPERK